MIKREDTFKIGDKYYLISDLQSIFKSRIPEFDESDLI